MRLSISRSPNATSYYVIKDYSNGKSRTSRIVEKLGTDKELRERLGDVDLIAWARAYIAELNRKEKEGTEPVVIARYSPSRQLERDVRQSCHGGYLFLQRLYHELGLHRICADISRRHQAEYDLSGILSALLYTRILFPGSKRSSHELSKRFIQGPGFDLHQVYRALDVINKESDYIQSQLYKNSLKLSKRNTGVLYYDCTNYFFEIEQESGSKQYGPCKEHRPNPIVQMGLFMDGDGIPLAFCIDKGNNGEQSTLKPLEKKILADFELSRFVVCTDAGLGSTANREFNNRGERAFVVTQSLKILKRPLQEWALEPMGWQLPGEQRTFELTDIDEEKHHNSIFYKEQWVDIKGLRQRMLVSYSIKYRDYQRRIRENQINRALQAIKTGQGKLARTSQNDYKRFITQTHCTNDGEVAGQTTYGLNEEVIGKEAAYDGFYAVCTSLSDDAWDIIQINKRRWEIEECFRIMKSEFKARPVYLSRDERIQAHFMTCFLSLVLYRVLEKRLDERFSCEDIIGQLKGMNFQQIKGAGYVPCYTRTDFTDALHDAFGFRTDFEIVSEKKMKAITRITKSS
ncbi:MAG: IS1634 family transposase [Christensenellales bacterium]